MALKAAIGVAGRASSASTKEPNGKDEYTAHGDIDLLLLRHQMSKYHLPPRNAGPGQCEGSSAMPDLQESVQVFRNRPTRRRRAPVLPPSPKRRQQWREILERRQQCPACGSNRTEGAFAPWYCASAAVRLRGRGTDGRRTCAPTTACGVDIIKGEATARMRPSAADRLRHALHRPLCLEKLYKMGGFGAMSIWRRHQTNSVLRRIKDMIGTTQS